MAEESQINLDRLEELARAASPGPWEFNFGGPEQQDDGSWYEPDQSGVVVGGIESDFYHDDARYIAAVSPDLILDLIAERRLWEKRALEALELANQNAESAQRALDLFR